MLTVCTVLIYVLEHNFYEQVIMSVLLSCTICNWLLSNMTALHLKNVHMVDLLLGYCKVKINIGCKSWIQADLILCIFYRHLQEIDRNFGC